MKNFALTILLVFLLAQSGESAISSSASYKIFGKLRERELVVRASSSFTIGEGFFKSVYFAPPPVFRITYAAPTIASITPAKGLNNETVSITNLAGTNFRAGAAVRLSKTGENDIIGTSVAVESSTKITCQFNLSGKPVGSWDVAVTNDDNQSAALSQGFKIEAPSVEIVGPVTSTQNPFNPSVAATSIQYTLSKDTDVTISIFNIRGEKIWQRVYPAGQAGSQAGANSVLWDGLTDFKSTVSFGVYIVQITTKVNGSIKEIGRLKIAVVK